MFGKARETTEYGRKLMNRRGMMRNFRNMDSDDILESLGLQRIDSPGQMFWPAFGGITFGLICGVAIGMAFAPKRGSELRHDFADKVRRRDYEGLGRAAREMVNESRSGTQGSAGRGNVII